MIFLSLSIQHYAQPLSYCESLLALLLSFVVPFRDIVSLLQSLLPTLPSSLLRLSSSFLTFISASLRLLALVSFALSAIMSFAVLSSSKHVVASCAPLIRPTLAAYSKIP